MRHMKDARALVFTACSIGQDVADATSAVKLSWLQVGFEQS